MEILESSEMKRDKEWLKSEIEIMGSETSENYPHEQMVDRKVVLNLIDQLDEPEKVVIPKYVADWWECDGDSVTLYGWLRVEKKYKFHLISKFHDKGLGDFLSKVEDWLDENKSTFLDLVNGKPYEVEKEKLYWVIDKSKRPILTIHEGKVIASASVSKVERAEKLSTPDYKYRLTEKQIKDYDERFWQFAVEVA